MNNLGSRFPLKASLPLFVTLKANFSFRHFQFYGKPVEESAATLASSATLRLYSSTPVRLKKGATHHREETRVAQELPKISCSTKMRKNAELGKSRNSTICTAVPPSISSFKTTSSCITLSSDSFRNSVRRVTSISHSELMKRMRGFISRKNMVTQTPERLMQTQATQEEN